jgi:predicted DNA-binding transcriptional regulator AlpA
MQAKFIRISELASAKDRAGRWPVSAATIWRWVADGLLEPPVRLGPGVSAWPVEVIERYEMARAEVPGNVAKGAALGATSARAHRARLAAGGEVGPRELV